LVLFGLTLYHVRSAMLVALRARFVKLF
jgi:hypothetical protein